MSALGTCPNLERCSKAVAKEPIDLYPGIGEVCPECGRRLEPTSAAPESSAPPFPEGFRPKYIQQARPAEQTSPPSTAGSNGPATPAPFVAPIQPIAPPPRDETFVARSDEAPDYESDPTAAYEPDRSTESEVTQAAAPLPSLEDPPADAPQRQAVLTPPPAAVAQPAPPRSAPPPIDPRNSWVIAPVEAAAQAQEVEADAKADAKAKRKPAIYAAIGVAALIALGGGYYAASNGTINVPGIPGFSTVSAASAMPAVPTFRICDTNGVSDKLVPDLVRGFLTKLGAATVDASPVAGTYSAQLPNHPPALIAVASGDAPAAFTSLASGACQLAITQAAMPAKARGGKAAIGETVLGLAGVSVIVHPTNPVQQLELGQVAKIFNGTITNWAQVGGPNLAIDIVVPQVKSDEYAAFKSMVLKDATLAPAAKRVDSLGAVGSTVGKAPGAIGITAFNASAPGRVLRLVARDGTPIVASTVNIGLKRYPLTTTVYLYDAAQTADPLAAQFVAFTQSDAGQAIVNNSNFVGRNSF